MRQYFFHCALFLAAVSPALWAAASDAADGILRRALGGEVNAPNAVDLSPHWLQAGPIRAKLQDGQLRYISVGDKEVIRRIYFAVRDGNWATAQPRFTLMKLENAADHFTVHMAAECKMGPVDYSWSGTITGTAEGKITFHAEGTPNTSFDSNRIGLCVLYGTTSLAKQEFQTDGIPTKGTFPVLVSPVHVADQFHKLQYTTDTGLTVACSADQSIFDMEDQRNWGDSSWKAFAPMAYRYPKIAKGETKGETVTLTVSGVNAANSTRPAEGPVSIRVGRPIPGLTMPKITAAPTVAPPAFTSISFDRAKFKDAKRIDWSYIPTTHLLDDDTIMENIPAVADQANTVLSFTSPHAELHVGPIRLDAKGADPRANTPFAAAWLIGMVHSLALGHVQQASFDLKGEQAQWALGNFLQQFAGWPLLGVEVSPKGSEQVLAFGCSNREPTNPGYIQALFLVNRTPHPVRVVLNLRGVKGAVETIGGPQAGIALPIPDGTKLELAPYDVRSIPLFPNDKDPG